LSKVKRKKKKIKHKKENNCLNCGEKSFNKFCTKLCKTMYPEKIPIEKLKNCIVCFNRYIEYQENNYEIEGNFCSQKCYERLIKDINSRLTKPEKLETRPKCITCGRRYEPLNEDDLTCKECKDFEKVCIIINCGNCGKEIKTTDSRKRFCSTQCKKESQRNKYMNKKEPSNNIDVIPHSKYLGEQKLSELVSYIFYDQEIFFRKRYEWLRYITNPLELDIYLPNINLAFEYDGGQHDKFTPWFHKTKQDFLDQQDRDRFKDKRCEEEGVTLIRFKDQIEYITNWSLINKLKEYGRSDILHSKYFDGIVISQIQK